MELRPQVLLKYFVMINEMHSIKLILAKGEATLNDLLSCKEAYPERTNEGFFLPQFQYPVLNDLKQILERVKLSDEDGFHHELKKNYLSELIDLGFDLNQRWIGETPSVKGYQAKNPQIETSFFFELIKKPSLYFAKMYLELGFDFNREIAPQWSLLDQLQFTYDYKFTSPSDDQNESPDFYASSHKAIIDLLRSKGATFISYSENGFISSEAYLASPYREVSYLHKEPFTRSSDYSHNYQQLMENDLSTNNDLSRVQAYLDKGASLNALKIQQPFHGPNGIHIPQVDSFHQMFFLNLFYQKPYKKRKEILSKLIDLGLDLKIEWFSPQGNFAIPNFNIKGNLQKHSLLSFYLMDFPEDYLTIKLFLEHGLDPNFEISQDWRLLDELQYIFELRLEDDYFEDEEIAQIEKTIDCLKKFGAQSQFDIDEELEQSEIPYHSSEDDINQDY